MVLENTLESPLDCKEIQSVNPKGNQSRIFIGRTDTEVETPILWPPDEKNWLIGKDPDVRKDWRWEEKGTTGWDGWMSSLTRWTWAWVSSGCGDGQGSLVCCSLWGHKELDMTEGLSWTELKCLNTERFWFRLSWLNKWAIVLWSWWVKIMTVEDNVREISRARKYRQALKIS